MTKLISLFITLFIMHPLSCLESEYVLERTLSLPGGMTNTIQSVAVTPDGQRIFALDSYGTVYMWDDDLDEPYQLYTHAAARCSKKLFCNTFMGKLVSCGYQGDMVVSDIQDGQKIFMVPPFLFESALSPCGTYVATAHSDFIAVQDLSTHQDPRIIHHSIPSALAMTNTEIAVGNINGTIDIIDRESGQKTATLHASHLKVNDISITPDHMIASGSEDGNITLWDLRISTHALAGESMINPIHQVTLNQATNTLRGVGYTVNIWDLRNRFSRRQILSQYNGSILSLEDIPATGQLVGNTLRAVNVWQQKQ